MPTMSSGTMTASPMIVWILAAREMPWCWAAKTPSSSPAPIRNVALMRSDSPSFSIDRSASWISQVRTAEVGSKNTLRM